MCDYLGISTINEQTVAKIKSIEDDLNNKNSGVYLGLLRFLEKRHQKSYLEGGFISAALKPFYGFVADCVAKTHQTGQFDSWEIIDEVTAIKHCDKSFFEHNGSGVPKGICWFFDAEQMNPGETKHIKLLFNGVHYQGRVKNETSDRRRVRIFWNTELGSLFNQYKSNDTTATFVRSEKDTFTISIRKEAQQKKSWLLAWNPNMWNWEDLREAAELTQNGDSYPTTWACTSSGVAPGDRVYIITLGTNNNGIMASGYATSTQYEYEHWDPDKRADGQTNKGIDISLDRIIDISEILSDEDYLHMVDAKLDEELAEYHADQNIEELADLMEVIRACAVARGYTIEQLEQVRAEKAAKRGGFEKKILLKEVTEP